jgi:hypothetical protein
VETLAIGAKCLGRLMTGRATTRQVQRLCITRSPDSNAKTHEVPRQPGAVKLMRVRRATAPGSNDPSGNKAGGFMHVLGGAICLSGQWINASSGRVFLSRDARR